MRIIFFTHPSFLGSQSMPRFAKMLADGMEKRGHQVEVWSPEAKVYNLPVPQSLRKWAGYIDQFVLFPALVKKKLNAEDKSTLFVFTDHALGPWVPLVANRAHVIHCHDFLAQRSANNEIAENPTSYSGKKYQAYIRQGYQKGKNFISVSEKTRGDLHKFLISKRKISEVVYNGLNTSFSPSDAGIARQQIGAQINLDLYKGYLLHIGGNQWYKNRVGVIDIYNAWRKTYNWNLPLIMIGPVANAHLMMAHDTSPYKKDIYLLNGKGDDFVKLAYNGASVFLFPSLAEGFGWPIAEAMASGCLVITTGEAPMTEVGGDAAVYIARKPFDIDGRQQWADRAAKTLNQLLLLPEEEKEIKVKKGIENSERFDLNKALDEIERIYQNVADASNSSAASNL